MADIPVRINEAALVALLRSPTGPVWREIQRKTNAVANYAKGSGNQMSNPKGKPNRWTYTKGRAPRASGDMANTIKANVTVKGNEIVGVVSANTDYAIFVHDGTRRGLKKRPFLKDALDIVMAQR